MTLQELRKIVNLYIRHHESGRLAKIKLKMSPRHPLINDLFVYVQSLSAVDSVPVALEEEYEIAKLLRDDKYDKSTLTEAQKDLIEDIREALWPSNPSNLDQAIIILKNANRLSYDSYQYLLNVKGYLVVKAALLYAWLPDFLFNRDTFAYLRTVTNEYAVAHGKLKRMYDGGVLTTATLRLLDLPYTEIDKTIDVLLQMKKLNVFSDVAASFLLHPNVNTKDLLSALIILQRGEILTADNLEILRAKSRRTTYTQLAHAICDLKNNNVYYPTYVALLKGSSHGSGLIDVIVLLDTTLGHEMALQLLEQHPAPHTMRKPLLKLRDANLLMKSEYIDLFFTNMPLAGLIIDVALMLREKNISFSLTEISNPNLITMVQLLNANDVLSQSTFDTVKEVKNKNYANKMVMLQRVCIRPNVTERQVVHALQEKPSDVLHSVSTLSFLAAKASTTGKSAREERLTQTQARRH